MTYDQQNIFAKILRKEIPCQAVYEDRHVLAFYDIQPKAPMHILVIPKGAYKDMNDFSARASDAEISALTRAIGKIVKERELDKSGYRLISNCGADGGQEVPHLHLHILGGRQLGRMVTES